MPVPGAPLHVLKVENPGLGETVMEQEEERVSNTDVGKAIAIVRLFTEKFALTSSMSALRNIERCRIAILLKQAGVCIKPSNADLQEQ